MRGLLCGLVLTLLVGVAPAARADRPEWEALRGLPILEVRVETSEVFDRARPGEDHVVLDWANNLHIVTRPHVVRREYAQRAGDAFDPRRAAECERNLRLLGVFQDAQVFVERRGAGVLVTLHTVDRWSLRASPIVSLQGGVNEVGVSLGERNVLGLGFELGALGVYSSDVSRVGFNWRDRRVLGSRWDAGIAVRFDDLGQSQDYLLSHPFHSDAVRWSADFEGGVQDGDRRLFESGEETTRFAIREGWLESAGSIHLRRTPLARFGFFQVWRQTRRDLVHDIGAVGVVAALLHHDSRYRRRVDRMGPEEELGLGWTLQAGLGADLVALGASRDRPVYRAGAQAATLLGDDTLVGALVEHKAFVDDGRLADGRLQGLAYGFWQPGPLACLTWTLGGDAYLGGLPYERFNLGSDNRLRGYPARTLNGSRVLYGSVEQRLFSHRRFLFLRLGAVVFVDAAAAWDAGEVLDRSHARLGAGLGLRIATDPAGGSITRLDLGFGTGSVELSLSGSSFFAVSRVLSFPAALFY